MIPLFQRYGRSTLYLLITDYLIVVGSFGVAMRIRFRPYIDIIDLKNAHLIPQVWMVALLSLLLIALFNSLKLYQRRTWLSPLLHAFQIAKGMIVAVAAYMFLRHITRASVVEESRLVAGIWGALATLFLLTNRLVIFTLVRRWATSAAMQRRIAIIGAGPEAVSFARAVHRSESRATMMIVGFVDDAIPAGTEVQGIRCLGSMADLPEMMRLHDLEGAVVIMAGISYQRLMDTVEECIRLFGWVDVHSDKAECLQKNLDPDSYFDIPFIRMRSMQKGPAILAQKRFIDLVGACAGIFVLSPLLLLTAALIKATSKGPVLYVSERIGRNGRPFRFYKFRTMVVGADRDASRAAQVAEIYRQSDAPMQSKCVNRSLLIPAGGFLRKWAIDELPQLFNVLKGDMSLVGPRPLPRGEYDLQDEWQKKRFEVQPGCTGLWKLYASRDRTMPFSQCVLYDIYYARNMNPLLDVAILLRTVWVILTGRADG